MDSCGTRNSQQMDHKEQQTSGCASSSLFNGCEGDDG